MGLPPACSGRTSEECSPTSRPEGPLPLPPSDSSTVSHTLTTRRSVWLSPTPSRSMRMKSGRNFTHLKDIAKIAGWAQGDLVDTLEDRRKAKSAKYYAATQAKAAAKTAATNDKSVAAFNGALSKLGF